MKHIQTSIINAKSKPSSSKEIYQKLPRGPGQENMHNLQHTTFLFPKFRGSRFQQLSFKFQLEKQLLS